MLMKPGDRFRMARERAGLSQGQAAKYAGTAQGYISGIENNNRWPSTWSLLKRLADKYGVSADYLLDIGQPASLEALGAAELIDALPAEKREAAVALLQAIIAFGRAGVEEDDPPQSEPVGARDGGGVTFPSQTEMEVQEMLTAKRDALLAQLQRVLPAQQYEYVLRSVEAGVPLTEAEINRLLEASGKQPLQQSLQLIDNGDGIGSG